MTALAGFFEKSLERRGRECPARKAFDPSEGVKGQNEPKKNAKRQRIIRNVPIPSPNHLILLQFYRKQDTALNFKMFGLFTKVILRFVASGAFRQLIVVV